MKKKGRPRKSDSKKPGQLNVNLCRFTFIVKKKKVADIKRVSEELGITIKDCMNEILDLFLNQESKFKKHIKAKKKKVIKGHDLLNISANVQQVNIKDEISEMLKDYENGG